MLENLCKKLFECHNNYHYVHYFIYILAQTLSYLVLRSLPSSSFKWTKDGMEFDPSRDPELKVTEEEGSSAFYTLSNTMDTLKQYQGEYVCYASNELGTAVSNMAVLIIDGKRVRIESLNFKGQIFRFL